MFPPCTADRQKLQYYEKEDLVCSCKLDRAANKETQLYLVFCVPQEHPDTVGGAMLTGMREAIRALRMLGGDNEEIAAAIASHADTSTAKKRRQVSCHGTCF